MTTQQSPVWLTNVDYDDERLGQFRKLFAEEGYVPLPGFLTPSGLGALRREVEHLESVATRRDFNMECMNDTPRHMTTVGGHVIADESAMICDLYSDPAVMHFLREVTGLDLIPAPDLVERHVANFLHLPGDIHGAHFDDYPVALLLFVETPGSPEDGGLLEFLANAGDLAEIDGPETRRAFHVSGDAYVLRTDTTAHRVTALTRPCRRVVLNFAYATPESATVTPSASLLYS
jgi:hypothetical protein